MRLIAAGHAYEAGGPRAVPRALVPRLRRAVAALARGDDRGRPGGGRALQARCRPISCCGSRRAPGSPAGTAPGGAAGRAGTSSARRWSRLISGPRSTSTAAASISNFRTTKTRSPRASARTTARRSPASGCTTVFSTSSARRCPSRLATWSWCAICCARRRARRFATHCSQRITVSPWTGVRRASPGPGMRSTASI